MIKHTVLLAFLAAFGAGQMPYTSSELGFTMMVPPGFLGEGADPLNTRALACFVSSPATAPGSWTRLCVERRGGVMPKYTHPIAFTWKGVDLHGSWFDAEWNGQPVTVYVAPVPLRKEPVYLITMAAPANREHAKAVLVGTLATLQGETPPAKLSRAERAERAGSTLGMIGSIMMAVGAGMWIMKRRQQQQG